MVCLNFCVHRELKIGKKITVHAQSQGVNLNFQPFGPTVYTTVILLTLTLHEGLFEIQNSGVTVTGVNLKIQPFRSTVYATVVLFFTEDCLKFKNPGVTVHATVPH